MYFWIYVVISKNKGGDSHIYSLKYYFTQEKEKNDEIKESKRKCKQVQKIIAKEQPYDFSKCKMNDLNNLTGAKIIEIIV